LVCGCFWQNCVYLLLEKDMQPVLKFKRRACVQQVKLKRPFLNISPGLDCIFVFKCCIFEWPFCLVHKIWFSKIWKSNTNEHKICVNYWTQDCFLVLGNRFENAKMATNVKVNSKIIVPKTAKELNGTVGSNADLKSKDLRFKFLNLSTWVFRVDNKILYSRVEW
jgi:hypothetical protein